MAVRWRWGLQSRPVRSATASGTGAPPRGRGRGGAFGLVACWRPGAGPAPSRSRRSRTVARSVRSRVRLSRHCTASRGRVKIRCARAAYTLAGCGRERGCDVVNDFGAVRAYRVIASRARTRGKSGRNRTAGFGPPGRATRIHIYDALFRIFRYSNTPSDGIARILNCERSYARFVFKTRPRAPCPQAHPCPRWCGASRWYLGASRWRARSSTPRRAAAARWRPTWRPWRRRAPTRRARAARVMNRRYLRPTRRLEARPWAERQGASMTMRAGVSRG